MTEILHAKELIARSILECVEKARIREADAAANTIIHDLMEAGWVIVPIEPTQEMRQANEAFDRMELNRVRRVLEAGAVKAEMPE